MKKRIILLLSFLLILTSMPLYIVSAEESDDTLKEEVIYDILIDRFNNGNQKLNEQVRLDDPYAFHGGDLEGITKKLDDLNEFGYTTISLSPPMANAPDGYHGYWIEDFYEIEPQFGTVEDLKELVEEAHKRDMKVMLELVTNYVADTHPIVKDDTKKDWLDKEKPMPVDDYPWLENVVSLNQDNPEVVDYLSDVATYWLEETGIDGYKLQAADQASPEFLAKLTDNIKKAKKDAYIIADVLVEESPELYDIDGIQLVANTEQYASMTDVFSKENMPVLPLLESWEQQEHQSGLLYVDNKYTKRFTELFSEQGRNKVTAWKLALTYMYTMPGVPLIYQGSEIPAYGQGVPENQRLVNFNSSEADLQEFIERISALREQFPVLAHGDLEIIDTDQGMSVYKRGQGDESVYVAINNDSESRSISMESIGSDKQLRGLLGDNLVREDKESEYRFGLPRETAEVYVIENNSGINWFFIGAIVGIFVIFIGAVIVLTRKQKKREALEKQ